MNRYYDVASEAALYESSDEEKSKKSTDPQFGLTSVNIDSFICKELNQTAREQSPSFNSRRHELLNQPQTRSQIPAIDPNFRIPAAFEQYMDNRIPYSSRYPEQRILNNREPRHIAQQKVSIPNQNYISKAQENQVDNLSRQESENREEQERRYKKMSRYYDVRSEAALYESSDEEYMGDRIPYAGQRLLYNREPSHIAQQKACIYNENYMNIRQEYENREEAGSSSQAVKRSNISDEHDLTYNLDNFSENHMIIFNHENFLESTRRNGSALDVESLRKTFEPLRFSVTVHKDLEIGELFATLKQFSKQDFRRCGCICVVILSHGSDHGYLEAFDGCYSERTVFSCFSAADNKSLTGKPIIFLIQACRGPNLSRRVADPEPDKTSNIEVDSSNVKKAGPSWPAESNIIIFHSSFFGKASARDPKKGSWFIQTVCEQIELYAASEDLDSIFLRVRNIVAREKVAPGGGKQMPITSTAFTKRLFLKKNTIKAYNIKRFDDTPA